MCMLLGPGQHFIFSTQTLLFFDASPPFLASPYLAAQLHASLNIELTELKNLKRRYHLQFDSER